MGRYFTLLFFFFFAAVSFGQNIQQAQVAKEQFTGSYPVHPDKFLREQDEKVAKFLQANPDYFTRLAIQKKAAWGFTVGATKSWTSWDLSTTPETPYQVTSTCRAVGTHCYVFVADNVWGTGVDSAAVAAVVNDFDNSTPADPNKGIYQTDVDTFGNPPDVDGDPKIIILILNIQDGYNGTGGYVAGFFNSANEVGTNNAEIYYMDANPTNLKTASGLETALSTAAHEFQHMINWNYHKTVPENTFTNEGLSMVAEIVCGYPASMQSLYAAEPNHYLFDWRRDDNTLVLNDYARAQRFFLYLKEQFGVGILKNIVQNNNVAVPTKLDGVITAANSSLNFNKVFTNWEIANELNDRTVNNAYGYVYTNLPQSTSTQYGNPNVTSSVGVQREAASYITFSQGSNLSIKFTGPSSVISVKAIEIGNNAASRVVDVPVGTQFTEPAFGTTYKTISFAIISTDTQYPSTVSYTATGVVPTTETELKWDITEPTGYLPLTPGDSVAVQFDGVGGGKLDSIKVALRGITPINGNIYTFVGLTNQMGGKKLGSFTATSTLTAAPVVVNSGGDYPYASPYPNWVKVDLTSANIDASNSFVVEFPIGAAYPATNRVVSTYYQSSGAYHNYAYVSKAPTTWTTYSVSGKTGYVFLYLVRAYVSFVVSGVKHEVELTPKEFSLAQNYPNPFNPTTKIDFTLPSASKVKVIIYNQLGQQVALLAAGDYAAGVHEINFDGANLASGVYYYRIDAGTYSQTKKMVLMK